MYGTCTGTVLSTVRLTYLYIPVLSTVLVLSNSTCTGTCNWVLSIYKYCIYRYSYRYVYTWQYRTDTTIQWGLTVWGSTGTYRTIKVPVWVCMPFRKDSGWWWEYTVGKQHRESTSVLEYAIQQHPVWPRKPVLLRYSYGIAGNTYTGRVLVQVWDCHNGTAHPSQRWERERHGGRKKNWDHKMGRIIVLSNYYFI